MDGRRFDGVARLWASGANRRTALRALAALALAGNTGRAAAQSGPAQDPPDVPCASNADCRGAIADQCVRGHCWRGRCAFAAIRCAAGYHCCGNGRCCEDEFAAPGCLSDADCASGDPCVRASCDNGLCLATIVDCVPGYVCCGNAECCPAP